MNAKTIRKWLILGGLLTAIGIAYADFNVQDKGSYYNNASTGSRTTSQGHQTVVESDPAMDANLTLPSIIGPSTLTLGIGDSSAVLDTHRMRLGMLLIKGVLAGTGTVDTTCVARLAVQIRTHIQGADDSSSTFAVYPYGVIPSMVATASAADTSQQGHIYAGVPLTGIAATPFANTAWSGEFTVVLTSKRNAHASSVSVNGHTFYYPSGVAIPLQSLYGRDMYSPYTSVRIRLLSFQKGAASLTTGTVILTAHLVGTPL